ncbi:DUF2794 domain-containing protein [Chelatococcus sp. SYSU_G07232]|uniref:DUF2794 domain-containing protein n=1 Tax=Chelatococcus albus TaxID=3047466 RepID=A0ABT7AK55_9HYPH|nr:DUF2794 domain-containing protein [Chelatococcus sp. SYSU_G07232]MDJ1159765.1 DUF2794 domain-containing protein [Chelatococcus sp. SYSU_G07232]
MSENELSETQRLRGTGGASVVPLKRAKPHGVPAGASAPIQLVSSHVSFDHRELRAIFDLYGRMVAKGEWRDYAIDFLRDKAVFSVFRRTSEMPLYRIEKDPKLARRQGLYSVVATSGLVLKRGHELPRVLRVLDRSLRLVSA